MIMEMMEMMAKKIIDGAGDEDDNDGDTECSGCAGDLAMLS